MKIKIAYRPEEADTVEAVAAAIGATLPQARRKESEAHPPYRHIYITTPKLEKACNTSTDAV